MNSGIPDGPRGKGTANLQHRPPSRERKSNMFARHLTFLLKANMAKEFPATFEKEILPLIRKQKGFLDELLLITPEKKEVVAISLWETKEHAETYHREQYPEIEKIMGKFLENTPIVKRFETEYASFRMPALSAKA